MRRLVFPLVMLVALAPQQVQAQTQQLDEGSFRLYLRGTEVGTETFTIRQTGTGNSTVTLAQGRIVVDTAGAEELTTSLEVQGELARPSGYQASVRGPEPQRIAARMLGGRFSAKIVSPAGEMMREYIASQGAILLEDGVAHHFYFLPRRDEAEFDIPVLIPRQNRQVSTHVTLVGSETVRIGERTLTAQHYRVVPADGAAREVWLDDRGRVLRLEIPERGYRAERVAAPN